MTASDDIDRLAAQLEAVQEHTESLELAIADHLAAVVAWQATLLALNAYAVEPQAAKRVHATQSQLAELLTLSAVTLEQE